MLFERAGFKDVKIFGNPTGAIRRGQSDGNDPLLRANPIIASPSAQP